MVTNVLPPFYGSQCINDDGGDDDDDELMKFRRQFELFAYCYRGCVVRHYHGRDAAAPVTELQTIVY